MNDLLQQPELLMELRDLALVAGGSYWDRVRGPEALSHVAARVAKQVKMTLDPHLVERLRTGNWRSHIGAMLATAAAVLVAVYLVDGSRSRPATASSWGLNRLDDLPRSGTPASVFGKFAELANQWNAKPTPDATALARRLIEFRQGCAAIQLARDLPLPADDIRWLKLRCADWAARIEEHLRTLEETRDTEGVQASVQLTIADIVLELTTRSRTT